MTRLEEALWFAREGFALLPQDRSKKPLIREWPDRATTDVDQIREWAKKWPKANFAAVCGKKSNCIIMDVDIKGGLPGLESLEKLKQDYEVPDTLTVRTGSGGLHLYFRYPEGVDRVKNAQILQYPGIEIKADRGAITLPGSVYSSGQEYKTIGNGQIAPCPDWLRDIVKMSSEPAQVPSGSPDPDQVITPGKRNQTLTQLGGQLRRVGNDYEIIRASLMDINQRKCNPPLPEAEVDAIAKSISTYDVLNPLYTLRMTESGMADRFLYLNGDQVFFVDDYKHWHVWKGTHWRKDNRREVFKLAHDMVIEMYKLGMAISDEKARSRFMSFVASWDRVSRLRGILEHSSHYPKIAKVPDELDSDKMLLNTLSGTIELDTMTFREHRQSDFISRVANAHFIPEAECPTWHAFLDRVVPDHGMQAFLQTAIGYSLTGDTSEQCLFILYGTGANGKSTFLETIAAMLGDYATHTVVDTLLIKQGNQIPNDVAALKGSRFVYSMESESGKRLAESLVKALTGGDTISARYLYGEFFSYVPSFKLWLGTNHRPVVKGQDYAIWRRIRLIPFEQVIPPEEQDRHMVDKLRKELPGILVWALEGLEEWKRNGLFIPEAVQMATAAYKDEMDILADFLASYCDVDVPDETPAQELFARYKEWATENNERVMSQRFLGLKLDERGFVKVRKSSGNFWQGIRLK